MKEFRRTRPGELGRLAWETRFIYTVFLSFSLVGLVVMILLAEDRAGFTTNGMTHYYAGQPEEGIYGKTYGEILDTTHFHLFSVPLALFVQGHLFLLSSWRRGWKVTIVLASYLGAALYIAAPWFLLYDMSWYAPFLNGGRALLGLSLLVYFAVPVWEMWGRPQRS